MVLLLLISCANGPRRFGSVLAVVVVALSALLLASTGLVGRSLWNLRSVDLGIESSGGNTRRAFGGGNADRLAPLDRDIMDRRRTPTWMKQEARSSLDARL